MHSALTWIDYVIMLIYFAFVLGIGFALKRFMKTSTDFFLSGRSIPAWVAGLAFISANLGAQEVIGMGANGAKYGVTTCHFYWLGAIPAMVFVGLFMMPFYYGSKARSVPEYLRLRFDEKTRALNAITFAVMTVFSSGISMFAMADLIQLLHIFDPLFQHMNWDPAWIFHLSIIISALIVIGYIYLGGLTSAIYNEVLQFFLIVAGFLPLVWLGLQNIGGWEGLKGRIAGSPHPVNFLHAWQGMEEPDHNPLGVSWVGLVMGLGFVLSFGYWCTDFLVVQRAMAADSMTSARRTPLIAAVPKMFFPFLVILPGLLAIALARPAVSREEKEANPAEMAAVHHGQGLVPAKVDRKTGKAILIDPGQPKLGYQLDYNMATPSLLLHYFPTGMLGIGLTALLASFMSGMAGNVTAFNTVWTFDIYQAYIKPNASDRHYLNMGHFATFFGTAISVAAAYAATSFGSIMDLLQLVFAFVNAPLFATFLLGMFWKRSTGHGAFFGYLSGIIAAAIHHGLTLPLGDDWGIHGSWITQDKPLLPYPSEMAQNFWTAIYAWSTCFVVTIVVSLFTQPRDERELVGLVYSLTPKPEEGHLAWFKRPVTLGVVVLVLAVVLNIIFY